MSFQIINHELQTVAGSTPSAIVDTTTYRATHKNTEKFKEGRPDSIVIHYTAGRNAATSAAFLAGDVKASAHLVIGRDGAIFQLVPFNIIAWHAGESSYNGISGFNAYAIGIELDNAGPLTPVGNIFESWFKGKYPANEAFYGIHRNENTARYWHTYTEKQVAVCEEICGLLIREYKIKSILGHEEISVGRKTDPGPAFPLDTFRERLLEHDRSGSQAEFVSFAARVAADKLNIREGAGPTHKLTAQPLKEGQEVTVLAEENGWYKVKTEITGWVSKGYIKKS